MRLHENKELLQDAVMATSQHKGIPGIYVDEAHYNFHTSTGRYKPFADALAY